jgi:ATP-dependent DNA helicase RecG
VIFYAGLIEQWGGGIGKMLDECRTAQMPQPVLEEVQGFRVTFRKATQKEPEESHGTSHERLLSPTEERVLAFCRKPRSREEIARELEFSPEYVRRHVLPGLIRAGKLAHTVPEKPQSRKQLYLAKPA